MTKKMEKMFHTGMVKKSILIQASKEKVWSKIGNIVGLTSWVLDVKKTTFLSKKRKGVGAIRKIVFSNGNTIEEHVVAWKDGESFTYIATDGLPLRVYVATISIKPKNKTTVVITWQSYINSKKMTTEQFMQFLDDMGSFYQNSLKNLKVIIEKSHT